MFITCITPFDASTSTAIMLLTLSSFASVMVFTPVTFAVVLPLFVCNINITVDVYSLKTSFFLL